MSEIYQQAAYTVGPTGGPTPTPTATPAPTPVGGCYSCVYGRFNQGYPWELILNNCTGTDCMGCRPAPPSIPGDKNDFYGTVYTVTCQNNPVADPTNDDVPPCGGCIWEWNVDHYVLSTNAGRRCDKNDSGCTLTCEQPGLQDWLSTGNRFIYTSCDTVYPPVPTSPPQLPEGGCFGCQWNFISENLDGVTWVLSSEECLGKYASPSCEICPNPAEYYMNDQLSYRIQIELARDLGMIVYTPCRALQDYVTPQDPEPISGCDGFCEYQWHPLGWWIQVSIGCTGDCVCNKPEREGRFDNDIVRVPCTVEMQFDDNSFEYLYEQNPNLEGKLLGLDTSNLDGKSLQVTSYITTPLVNGQNVVVAATDGEILDLSGAKITDVMPMRKVRIEKGS
jgi:hypothetical protein